jgi:hypothetical protein
MSSLSSPDFACRQPDTSSSRLSRTVNTSLTVAAEPYTPPARGERSVHADGAADLTRGGGPYACARIGLASRLPALPNEGRREGSLVKSAAAQTASVGSAGPCPCLSRQPTGVRGPAGREQSGSPAAPAESAARAAPRGRLEPVQEVLTERLADWCPAPLDVRHRGFT